MGLFKKSKVISMRYLAEMAGVNIWKIYNRKYKGKAMTNSPLNPNDATKLANALTKELIPLFNDLGYDIKVTRQKASEEVAQSA